jgi:hypothetical protein
MSYSRTELRRTLTAKLGLELDRSADHPVFTLWHEGRAVARTHISHGSGKDVGQGLISAMARQLGVTGPELRDSLDCRLTGEAFVALILVRAARDRH